MKTLLQPFFWGLYRPSHAKLLIADWRAPTTLNSKLNNRSIRQELPTAVEAAMQWLCRAQDANHDGGVAAGYSLRCGWESSYPETTGYIIPTFFDYYHLVQRETYRSRALQMADWLLSIQQVEGSFPGGFGPHQQAPLVFDTGQILFGLVRAYQETQESVYLQAASRAGDWLVRVQEADGAWRRYTYAGPVSYHARVAWALLEVFGMTGEARYRTSARRNLDWCLSNQTGNGWFEQNIRETDGRVLTHLIGYTMRGLLESGLLLDNDEVLTKAAQRAADVLLGVFMDIGKMAGAYGADWQGNYRYNCLTGCAQISIVWQKLFLILEGKYYLEAAFKINRYLRAMQDRASKNPGIRGGIRGSVPIWGSYQRANFPNWAAKFFVDAMVLEHRLTSNGPLQ